MSDLFKHANNRALTANEAETYASSLDACVDFFFLAGSSRGKDIRDVFLKAVRQDHDVALRILQWMRDVRQGAGERQQFRELLNLMVEKKMPESDVSALINKIPELGRWDDLHGLFGTKYEEQALFLILTGLKDGNALCAKWLPRKGVVFNTIRKLLKVTPKELRKTLVEMSNTVEQKMCAKLWNDIDFGKLPSLAASRYSNAFMRNSEERYIKYKKGLTSGDEKINAGAIHPHDIVTNVIKGQADIADAQWKALPDYLDGTTENILPVVDVSYSMNRPIGGGSNTTCMQVSIALGMYLAERNNGIFKDKFVTFSETPSFDELKGVSLKERIDNLKSSHWGYSTDLQRVFQITLDIAVANNLPQAEMPSTIMILSDMEFNRACTNTNLEGIKARYKTAGYKPPKLVFWNLNGRIGNVPARVNDKNTALVSGFSPSIMKSVLAGKDFTPKGIMLETVMIDRYAL